ncbi:RapZ C-terminal domain-containing protein [Saccharopolyspora shandongensis]|uniref:RapZ C-terminal domain-containing protein n=1 Tax=Saccharopolyspora shandongensis TaxID=418495 RepID=UPI0033FFC6C9
MSEVIFPVVLEVLTWGYNRRNGPPPHDLSVNVRWIPNPYQQPDFHDMSGLDQPVQDWVFDQPGVAAWFESLLDLLGPIVAGAETSGQRLVTVAIGCQGGHDRSVSIAIKLAEAFERAGTRTHVKHLSFVRGPR